MGGFQRFGKKKGEPRKWRYTKNGIKEKTNLWNCL